MLKEVLKPFSQKAKYLIILGIVTWVLTMVKSGICVGECKYGIGYWGANGHDGIWHIALSESLAKGSFNIPIFSGAKIQNYHIGFDIIQAVIHKITHIPLSILYFQITPVILATLIGYFTYLFVYKYTKSSKSAWWSTFFVFFGGGFAYLVGKGESAFWSTQAISTLINPPFALSLVIILIGLIKMIDVRGSPKIADYLILGVLFGILTEIKIYGAILVLASLFVSGLWEYLSGKKTFLIKIFFTTLAVSLILYLPLNKDAAGLVILQPFWFIETMMGLTDRVGWVKFAEAMVNYRQGGVWPKAILAYGFAFAVFVFGNLGTRAVMLFNINLKKLRILDIFLYSVILGGIIIPTLFLQKGTPWNTIQFFYYTLFFSGIFAGIAMHSLLNKIGKKSTKLVNVFVCLIILLTIPVTVTTLKDVYLPVRPPATLPSEEYEALDFLSRQADGVVLTYPFDITLAKKAESRPPRPLYLYTSTAYVAAYSKHPVVMEDEINLDITGYDWKDRRNQIEDWYKEVDMDKARKFFSDYNVKYIYWVKPQRALLGEDQLGLTKIFENTKVVVYRVE